MTPAGSRPGSGIAYRIDGWTRENRDRFDVVEVAVDHRLHVRP
jgi:hypothetical protein